MTDKEPTIKLGGPSLLEEDPHRHWDIILNDTWYHNEYYDLMCKLMWKKYPIEEHESSVWADPVTKSEEEMRQLIDEIADYWKGHIRTLLTQVDEEEYPKGFLG